MRLLFLSNLYPPLSVGGYEEVCFDAAQGLKRRGHEVCVLASAFRAPEVRGREEGVHRLLKLSNWDLGIAGPTPWVSRTKLGLEWHNTRAVRRMIARFRPDLVLIWNGGLLGRALLSVTEESTNAVYYLSDFWLAWLLRQKRHGQNVSPGRRLRRQVLRMIGIPIAAVPADHLVFCSRALVREYEKAGADVSHARVIYHGVSSKLFSLRTQHILSRSPEDPYRILYVGRITPDKGVMTLVRALARVRALPGLDGTRLSLLGPTQDQLFTAQLGSEIRNLGLERAVEFLSRRPRSELPQVYGQHDVLAFPSEWQEPFSLTLLEAMATGLPVVSTVCGGSAEVVRDGENAVTFQAGDPNDLAGRLGWVLQHPQDAAVIGQAASAEVTHRYSLESQVGSLEAYLKSVLVSTRTSHASTHHRCPSTAGSAQGHDAAETEASSQSDGHDPRYFCDHISVQPGRDDLTARI